MPISLTGFKLYAASANKYQQCCCSMQTDATCWAQQCCVLLANNEHSKCHRVLPTGAGCELFSDNCLQLSPKHLDVTYLSWLLKSLIQFQNGTSYSSLRIDTKSNFKKQVEIRHSHAACVTICARSVSVSVRCECVCVCERERKCERQCECAGRVCD